MSIELELGELKGRLHILEENVRCVEYKLEKKMNSLDTKLDSVLDIISQTKGGWKMLAFIVTGAVSIGAFLGNIITVKFGG